MRSPGDEERVAAVKLFAERLGDVVRRLCKGQELDEEDILVRIERLMKYAEGLRLGKKPRVPRAELRWQYKTALPIVRAFRSDLRLGDPEAIDVAAFLKRNRGAVSLAADLKFKWRVGLCKELLGTPPSAWLIERLADRYDCSARTVKSRLYLPRKKRHAA